MRKIVAAMACGAMLVGGSRLASAQQVGQYADPEAPCDVSTSSHYLVNSADLMKIHTDAFILYKEALPRSCAPHLADGN